MKTPYEAMLYLKEKIPHPEHGWNCPYPREMCKCDSVTLERNDTYEQMNECLEIIRIYFEKMRELANTCFKPTHTKAASILLMLPNHEISEGN